MALRLTVRRDAFRSHVLGVARDVSHLVPVVKGNGYGLGRPQLVRLVGELLPATTTIAVGTIHEAHDIPDHYAVHVMNPVGELDLTAVGGLPTNVIPTVGSTHDVDVLARHGWSGRVVIKLASAMRRFGASRGEFSALVHDVGRIGGAIHACSIHPPTAGSDDDRLAEIRAWLPVLPACVTLSVSHLSAESLSGLRDTDTTRTIEARLGTALWHGTKDHFALNADIMRTEACRSGESAGYRSTPVPGNGTLVIVGAGSAHGVTPLHNGDSPFHFARCRMTMLENPYMHSTIAFVPENQPCPGVGDLVDVQRPLTTVNADIVDWV